MISHLLLDALFVLAVEPRILWRPRFLAQCAELAWGWLNEQPKERYINYLDHDGSDGDGNTRHDLQSGSA